jgi:hypothetical protein
MVRIGLKAKAMVSARAEHRWLQSQAIGYYPAFGSSATTALALDQNFPNLNRYKW